VLRFSQVLQPAEKNRSSRRDAGGFDRHDLGHGFLKRFRQNQSSHDLLRMSQRTRAVRRRSGEANRMVKEFYRLFQNLKRPIASHSYRQATLCSSRFLMDSKHSAAAKIARLKEQ
jgi:hypothetical protein